METIFKYSSGTDKIVKNWHYSITYCTYYGIPSFSRYLHCTWNAHFASLRFFIWKSRTCLSGPCFTTLINHSANYFSHLGQAIMVLPDCKFIIILQFVKEFSVSTQPTLVSCHLAEFLFHVPVENFVNVHLPFFFVTYNSPLIGIFLVHKVVPLKL